MAQILVVEDDDALRRIITLALARREHSVAEADSVATAMEILAAAVHPIDVIILDLNLPDRTGWDLLRALPSLYRPGSHTAGTASVARAPKVIVMTAVRPVQCRMDEFAPAALLLKPFPIDALVRLLERVLRRPVEVTPPAEQALPSAAESA
jgi:two-component system KDP operon response regulator KdpE